MLYILTLTWNACDKLTTLKKSLLPALKNIPYKWFIKDNDSKDNTYEVASSWGQDVKIFKYKNNSQNFSEGMNYLFNEASPNDDDLILLLNNDVIFNDKTSIKNMISLIEKNEDVGAVGARLFFTGTNILQHAGVVFCPPYNGPIHFRAKEPSDVNAEKNRLFQVVTGAVLLTKAKYFKAVSTTNPSGIHGMDEKFCWAFDDVDLCLHINYIQNKKIVYCGKTNISHEESASLKKNPVGKMFLNQNWNRLHSKWDKNMIIDSIDYKRNPEHNLFKG